MGPCQVPLLTADVRVSKHFVLRHLDEAMQNWDAKRGRDKMAGLSLSQVQYTAWGGVHASFGEHTYHSSRVCVSVRAWLSMYIQGYLFPLNLFHCLFPHPVCVYMFMCMYVYMCMHVCVCRGTSGIGFSYLHCRQMGLTLLGWFMAV